MRKAMGFALAAAAMSAAVAAGSKTEVKASPDEAAAPGAAAQAPLRPDPLPPVATDPAEAVRQLYAPYMKDGDQTLSAFDNETERARRFSASLVRAMSAYFKSQEKADEPGGLDFDPIVNGQDYAITDLAVSVDVQADGRSALAVAAFKNFDEAAKLRYRLVQEAGVWRVDNIESLQDPVWDLRAILKGG
jgi:hypothetical protein